MEENFLPSKDLILNEFSQQFESERDEKISQINKSKIKMRGGYLVDKMIDFLELMEVLIPSKSKKADLIQLLLENLSEEID